MNYKEFLLEASISDVKAAALAGVQSGKYKYSNDEDSRFQFARDMKSEGFRGSEVSNAWKSLAATGDIFKSPTKSGPTAAKVAPKADTKSIESKWNDILKILQTIKIEGGKVSAVYKSEGGNTAVHAQDAGYVDDVVKIVKDRIWSIKQLK